MYSIETVTPEQGPGMLAELVALLQDSVDSGASIGFLPPLSEQEARAYWAALLEDVAHKKRVLLVARDGDRVVGTIQLELASKPNARHRAEVQKLIVLQQQRKRGLGHLLMEAIEATARAHERTLLVLDTRQGDDAERLYRRLGYREAGIVPAYARNGEGTLDATVIFYKLL